ncbi:ubiquilin [Acrasis kona]|uniref:Ubiquilin n=1 Tax=Acrasis kona TaxID=1008807 RepID=A0AAW2Z0N5_9EUKA
MKLSIRSPNGDKFDVEVADDATVAEFKEVIAKSSNVPAEQQRLIYRGRVLKDPKTLKESDVQEGYAIHLVKGARPAGSTSDQPASSTTTTNPSSTSNPSPSNPTTTTAPPSSDASSNNPFNMFGSGAAGFGGGLGGLGDPTMGMNPEQMEQMMNNPMVQNMLSNPEVVRQMMMSNPQMREVMQNNPEVGRILSDPEMLRRTMELSRNPNLMREMMRNSDRAMSNIEGMPGGFDALRRMYTDVQQPLHEATSNMTSGDADSQSSQNNPFASLFPNANQSSTTDNTNTNPLPNPWGGPSTTSSQTGGAQQQQQQQVPPNLFGGGMNQQGMQQMMQNPVMQQITQQLMSDPQLFQQMLQMNPQLQQMAQGNPMLQQMLQNPQMLQQMMQLQNLMFQQQQQPSPSQQAPQQSTTNTQQQQPNQNAFADMMRQMMMGGGGFGGNDPFGFGQFGVPPVVPQSMPSQTSNIPPAELYATQLQQLKDMGFTDEAKNITALQSSRGNVNAAIEYLLSNPYL